MSGILSFHRGGGVKHTHGASSGSGSGTTQQSNIAGNIVIGSPTSQSGPKKKKKLTKKSPDTSVYQQAASSGYMGAGYIPPEERQIINAASELKNIVDNKDNTANQQGIVSVPKKFIKPGGVFDPNDMPASYADMNEAQKSIFNFYASSTPNLYQQQINDFITASPLNMEVYKNSGLKGAGLNAFMTTMPEKLFKNSLVGGIINAIASPFNKAKKAGKKIAEDLSPLDAKNINTNLEENQSVIETLGKQDPNRFGSLDRPTDALGTEGYNIDDVDIFDPSGTQGYDDIGTVYDPNVSKVDFINKVFGTNYTVETAAQALQNLGGIDAAFQKAKQKQGNIIREDIANASNYYGNLDEQEQPPIAGQFQFENFLSPDQDVINITGAVDPNSFPEEGVNKPATQTGQTLLFSDGTEVQEPFDTGLDVVGDSVFPSDAGSQEALDILNSNAESGFSGYPTMRYNFADGGYTGMSTYQKLKMMADSIG